MIMPRNCRSRKGLFPGVTVFQPKMAGKCSIDKRQPYQPKLVVVETVDPNRSSVGINCFSFSSFLTLVHNYTQYEQCFDRHAKGL